MADQVENVVLSHAKGKRMTEYENAKPCIIDAHIHTWQLNDGRLIWTREKIGALYRDFTIADFKEQHTDVNPDGIIIVQATTTRSETIELLQQYANDILVRGVIGWVDLAADDIALKVEELTQLPKLIGIRAHPPHHFDTNWLMSAPVIRGMKMLAKNDIAIDYLVNTTQLDKFRAILDEVPGVRAVLNHGGRPFVMTGDTTEWKRDIYSTARDTDCYCKLSGLVERAGVEWNKETLKPWVEILIDAFGPERLIYASNWPIMTLMATPKIWVNTLIDLFDDFGLEQSAREQIFNTTAMNVYQCE